MDDLVSRQAAINKARERLIEIALNNVGIKQNVDEVLVDVAEERLENWLDEVPSAQPEQRWIPVTERVPEAETLVWMTTTWGGVAVGFRRAGNEKGWRGGFSSFYTCKDIIAWMPLKRPEPYKGG